MLRGLITKYIARSGDTNSTRWIGNIDGVDGVERWLWCGQIAVSEKIGPSHVDRICIDAALKLWNVFLNLLDQDENTEMQVLEYLQAFEFPIRFLCACIPFLSEEDCVGPRDAVVFLISGMKGAFELVQSVESDVCDADQSLSEVCGNGRVVHIKCMSTKGNSDDSARLDDFKQRAGEMRNEKEDGFFDNLEPELYNLKKLRLAEQISKNVNQFSAKLSTLVALTLFIPASALPPVGPAIAKNTATLPSALTLSTLEAFTAKQLLDLSGVPTDRLYLLESDVGITAFLNPLQNFATLSAIIKHRYTDFLVNEVDPAGNVLHLDAVDTAAVEARQIVKAFDLANVPESVFAEMRGFFNEAEADSCLQKVKDILAEKVQTRAVVRTAANEAGGDKKRTRRNDGTCGEVTTSEAGVAVLGSDVVKSNEVITAEKAKKVDGELNEKTRKEEKEIWTRAYPVKEERVAVYDFFKTHFPEKLATDLRPDNRINLRLFTSRDRQRSIPRPDFGPSGPGEHLSFILYKENKDTMDCLNSLARVTGTQAMNYTFAGTKDKRGVTVQKCSGHRVFQSKLEGVNLGPNIKIGNFKYVKERVNLGDLLGNQFAITLRDVALTEKSDTKSEKDISEILQTSLDSLQKSGFINYYGMQRFGTRSISTHQVGLAMLAGSWGTAVDLIMMPKGDEKQEIMDARKLWMEKRDYKACFHAFPRYCVAERAVMQAMVPRNLRLMYVHSVQSFIWNHAASERIRLYGSKIVKGDLVAKYNAYAPKKSKLEEEVEEAGDLSDIAAIAEHKQGRLIEVELVETDEQAAQKSIEDLVLPLPGHSIKYPTNEIGKFYEEFMAKYLLDPHDMKRKNRETSLAGDYRRVVIKPKDISWNIMRYDDPNFPLSRTDLDIINGVPEPVSIPDGKRIGVVVRFTLETSSYATMALREILRSDTSAGYQSTLSASSKKETDAERESFTHVVQ
ncbi:hypothetical protein HK100_010888 [Physocladia obscura]|uniref:TRUD domain-containing protein n=1 Tax=Physocladia obscura TaxID=109957 RepID=A0AAD5TAF3_9FUNG|nr:hypothetical protein HK100_010888 [Physocladia obscura]